VIPRTPIRDLQDVPQHASGSGSEEVPSEEGILGPDEDVAPRRISRNFT